MISNQKIGSIAADKRVMDIVIEKDYVLDWILWGISQNDYLRKILAFKGGTALHKIYFTDWRFSEDLDFTSVHQIYLDELRVALPALCKEIENRSGLRFYVKEIESSGKRGEEWSYQIKIEYIGPRKQAGGNLPIVLLHITNDEPIIYKPVKKMILKPYEDLPIEFTILAYQIDEILVEKMRTVVFQRCFPRDVYDLWRLLKEIANYVDTKELLYAYKKKCLHRGFNHYEIPDNIIERVGRLENQWKEGLKRQIANPPEFDIVSKELIENLSALFKKQNILAKGGIDMIESNYVLRYKKGDLEIEVQGDKAFVETKFNELLNIEVELKTKPQPVEEKSTIKLDKELSLGEFVKQKNPKSHADKILVFGYYLENIKGYESFNIDDIEECYQDVRMPKTKNFSPYITQLIREGKIMDSKNKKDNKKAWLLTNDGMEYVESYGVKSE